LETVKVKIVIQIVIVAGGERRVEWVKKLEETKLNKGIQHVKNVLSTEAVKVQLRHDFVLYDLLWIAGVYAVLYD
jgi:hypothetical protein